MKIIRRAFPSLAALALVSGCVTMPGAQTTSTPEDARPCARNVVVEGSSLSLSGTQYKNTMFVPGVSKKNAMDRASKHIALEGMTITTLDREGGLIVAANKVISAKVDTVPLVVTFEQVKDGLKLEMKFRNGFGQLTSEDIVRNGFCDIVSAIENK
jgi:hypothetical protein